MVHVLPRRRNHRVHEGAGMSRAADSRSLAEALSDSAAETTSADPVNTAAAARMESAKK